MAKPIKIQLRRLLLLLCASPLAALAADADNSKESLLWGYWFSLSEVWQMHDPDAQPRLLIDNNSYPVAASPAFVITDRENIVSSLVRFSSESLMIDMPHDRNHYTAAINFGEHQSLQTGLGITRFWLGSAYSERNDHEYISLIVRYGF